jgi:uncharacterized protein YgbK (DUF1537 family)
MNVGDDYEIVQDETAPKGRRIVKKGQAQAVKAEVIAPVDMAMTPVDDFSDSQLRDIIKEKTGKPFGGRAKRETLIGEFKRLMAGAG